MKLPASLANALENAAIGAITGSAAGAATAPDSTLSGMGRGALGGALSGMAAGHFAKVNPEVAAAVTGLGGGGIMGLLPQKTASIEYRGHTFPGYNKPIVNKGGGKHKMKVLAKKGDKVKLIGFGHRDYGHNYSAKAKANYLKRSAGIKNKSGKLTKNDKLSANYWARRVLWPSGPATGAAKKTASATLADVLKSVGPTLATHTAGGAALGGLTGGLTSKDDRIGGAARGALLGAGFGLGTGASTAGLLAYKGGLPHQIAEAERTLAANSNMFDSAIREAQGLISDQQAAIAQHGLRETLLKVLKPTPEIQRQLAEASAAKAEAAAEITRLRQELDEVFAHRDSVLPGLTGDLARRKEEKLINYPMGAITAAGGVAAGASGTENPTLKSASLASTLSSMADTAIGSALVGGGGSALLAEPGHRRDAAVRGALMGGSTGALLGIATPPGLSGLIENSMIGGTLGTMGSYLTEPVKGSSGAAQRADETSNDEAVARRMGYNNYDEYYNNFMQSSMENPLDFNVTHPNGTVDVYRDGSLQVGKTASLSRNSPATLAGVLRSLGGTWHK